MLTWFKALAFWGEQPKWENIGSNRYPEFNRRFETAVLREKKAGARWRCWVERYMPVVKLFDQENPNWIWRDWGDWTWWYSDYGKVPDSREEMFRPPPDKSEVVANPEGLDYLQDFLGGGRDLGRDMLVEVDEEAVDCSASAPRRKATPEKNKSQTQTRTEKQIQSQKAAVVSSSEGKGPIPTTSKASAVKNVVGGKEKGRKGKGKGGGKAAVDSEEARQRRAVVARNRKQRWQERTAQIVKNSTANFFESFSRMYMVMEGWGASMLDDPSDVEDNSDKEVGGVDAIENKLAELGGFSLGGEGGRERLFLKGAMLRALPALEWEGLTWGDSCEDPSDPTGVSGEDHAEDVVDVTPEDRGTPVSCESSEHQLSEDDEHGDGDDEELLSKRAARMFEAVAGPIQPRRPERDMVLLEEALVSSDSVPGAPAARNHAEDEEVEDLSATFEKFLRDVGAAECGMVEELDELRTLVASRTTRCTPPVSCEQDLPDGDEISAVDHANVVDQRQLQLRCHHFSVCRNFVLPTENESVAQYLMATEKLTAEAVEKQEEELRDKIKAGVHRRCADDFRNPRSASEGRPGGGKSKGKGKHAASEDKGKGKGKHRPRSAEDLTKQREARREATRRAYADGLSPSELSAMNVDPTGHGSRLSLVLHQQIRPPNVPLCTACWGKIGLEHMEKDLRFFGQPNATSLADKAARDEKLPIIDGSTKSRRLRGTMSIPAQQDETTASGRGISPIGTPADSSIGECADTSSTESTQRSVAALRQLRILCSEGGNPGAGGRGPDGDSIERQLQTLASLDDNLPSDTPHTIAHFPTGDRNDAAVLTHYAQDRYWAWRVAQGLPLPAPDVRKSAIGLAWAHVQTDPDQPGKAAFLSSKHRQRILRHLYALQEASKSPAERGEVVVGLEDVLQDRRSVHASQRQIRLNCQSETRRLGRGKRLCRWNMCSDDRVGEKEKRKKNKNGKKRKRGGRTRYYQPGRLFGRRRRRLDNRIARRDDPDSDMSDKAPEDSDSEFWNEAPQNRAGFDAEFAHTCRVVEKLGMNLQEFKHTFEKAVKRERLRLRHERQTALAAQQNFQNNWVDLKRRCREIVTTRWKREMTLANDKGQQWKAKWLRDNPPKSREGPNRERELRDKEREAHRLMKERFPFPELVVNQQRELDREFKKQERELKAAGLTVDAGEAVVPSDKEWQEGAGARELQVRRTVLEKVRTALGADHGRKSSAIATASRKPGIISGSDHDHEEDGFRDDSAHLLSSADDEELSDEDHAHADASAPAPPPRSSARGSADHAEDLGGGAGAEQERDESDADHVQHDVAKIIVDVVGEQNNVSPDEEGLRKRIRVPVRQGESPIPIKEVLIDQELRELEAHLESTQPGFCETILCEFFLDVKCIWNFLRAVSDALSRCMRFCIPRRVSEFVFVYSKVLTGRYFLGPAITSVHVLGEFASAILEEVLENGGREWWHSLVKEGSVEHVVPFTDKLVDALEAESVRPPQSSSSRTLSGKQARDSDSLEGRPCERKAIKFPAVSCSSSRSLPPPSYAQWLLRKLDITPEIVSYVEKIVAWPTSFEEVVAKIFLPTTIWFMIGWVVWRVARGVYEDCQNGYRDYEVFLWRLTWQGRGSVHAKVPGSVPAKKAQPKDKIDGVPGVFAVNKVSKRKSEVDAAVGRSIFEPVSGVDVPPQETETIDQMLVGASGMAPVFEGSHREEDPDSCDSDSDQGNQDEDAEDVDILAPAPQETETIDQMLVGASGMAPFFEGCHRQEDPDSCDSDSDQGNQDEDVEDVDILAPAPQETEAIDQMLIGASGLAPFFDGCHRQEDPDSCDSDSDQGNQDEDGVDILAPAPQETEAIDQMLVGTPGMASLFEGSHREEDPDSCDSDSDQGNQDEDVIDIPAPAPQETEAIDQMLVGASGMAPVFEGCHRQEDPDSSDCEDPSEDNHQHCSQDQEDPRSEEQATDWNRRGWRDFSGGANRWSDSSSAGRGGAGGSSCLSEEEDIVFFDASVGPLADVEKELGGTGEAPSPIPTNPYVAVGADDWYYYDAGVGDWVKGWARDFAGGGSQIAGVADSELNFRLAEHSANSDRREAVAERMFEEWYLYNHSEQSFLQAPCIDKWESEREKLGFLPVKLAELSKDAVDNSEFLKVDKPGTQNAVKLLATSGLPCAAELASILVDDLGFLGDLTPETNLAGIVDSVGGGLIRGSSPKPETSTNRFKRRENQKKHGVSACV